MKKLTVLFSIIFIFGIIAASAQTPAAQEQQKAKTETAKCGDAAKAKGCCASAAKSCKAGSMKCCSKEKSSAKAGEKAEAVAAEKKEESTPPDNNR